MISRHSPFLLIAILSGCGSAPARTGVTFHEGGTLEPHDVAYTNVRAMLHGSMQSRKHADLLGRCKTGVDHFKAEVL